MAPKRKLRDEDTETDETEDDDNDEQQPSSVMQKQQVIKWGLWSQANQTHVHHL
jgi:hypothetical protein